MWLRWCDPQEIIYFSEVHFLSGDMEDDGTCVTPYLHHISLGQVGLSNPMLQMPILDHSEWKQFHQVFISVAKPEKINIQNCAFVIQMPNHHILFLTLGEWREAGGGGEEEVGGMRKQDWRERLHLMLWSVYSTFGNLRDLVQIFKICLVNSWKLNLRENQALCVPLNGSHPSIILFHVWYVLSILSSCCSCLLCIPSDSLLMSSHLASYVLLDFH